MVRGETSLRHATRCSCQPLAGTGGYWQVLAHLACSNFYTNLSGLLSLGIGLSRTLGKMRYRMPVLEKIRLRIWLCRFLPSILSHLSALRRFPCVKIDGIF